MINGGIVVLSAAKDLHISRATARAGLSPSAQDDKRSRTGMSLLEVIVALTVAGAALAAGAAVLGFLVDQQNRTGAQGITSASAVRFTMRSWTSDVMLTTAGDAEFRGTPDGYVPGSTMIASRNESRDGELTFLTIAPTEVAPAGTRVHMHMQARGGLVAELVPWRRNGPPMVVSLAPDATGFRVRYLSSLYGRPEWQDSWVSTSVLPAAVELRIVFDSTASAEPVDRAAHALLSLPMTVPLAGRR